MNLDTLNCTKDSAVDASQDKASRAAVPLLAVLHGWLQSPALHPAKQLLFECLAQDIPRLSTSPSSQEASIVQVEWAFSGKVVPGKLYWPQAAKDEVACVLALQKDVAKMLNDDAPVKNSAFQDVRMFAGHNGPELTWRNLAWFPARTVQVPPEAIAALQLVQTGTVLVATRGDFFTRIKLRRAEYIGAQNALRFLKAVCTKCCLLKTC